MSSRLKTRNLARNAARRHHGVCERPRLWLLITGLSAELLSLGCNRKPHLLDAVTHAPNTDATGARRLRPRVTGLSIDPQFVTGAELFAGIEMQQSGEPFAESMGRVLAGYDRNNVVTDQYLPNPTQAGATQLDPTGYAAAVESYEYSRQPMNNLAFESSAGISLAFSPTLTGVAREGRDAQDALKSLIERSALATHAGVRVARGSRPRGYVTVPAPSDNPLNVLGFGGIWPTSVPFVSFDPTIRPSNNATRGCTIEGGYGATAGQSVTVGDYECGYSSLQLPSRFGQCVREIGAAETGLALWKYGLWIINYLQLFHDANGHAVRTVPAEQLTQVGLENNTVTGLRSTGAVSDQGVYLGSSDLEGFQGALLIAQTLAQTEVLLFHTLTQDGTTWTPFASVRDVDAYNDRSPARWMPTRVAVDEIEDTEAHFARVTRYRFAATAEPPTLSAQLALLGGFATLWTLVDSNNPEIGQSPTVGAYFDGSPFSREIHRQYWLAGVRWALVTLELMFASEAGVYLPLTQQGSIPVRAITNDELTQVIVTLRRTRRALSGRLVLYGDSTPDARVTRTALDQVPTFAQSTVADRLTRRLDAHAASLYDSRSTADGLVRDENAQQETRFDGYLVVIRGLLEGYLATGNTAYRERAQSVWHRAESLFYLEEMQLFVHTRDLRDPAALRWTPTLWAHFTATMRELFKLVASAPGEQPSAARLLAQWTRMSKLVLNGWDDRNNDQRVDWPQECIRLQSGLPRGGLQMAERALSGELGMLGEQPTSDRDHDCVPEIDDVFLPAALAASLQLSIAPQVIDRLWRERSQVRLDGGP